MALYRPAGDSFMDRTGVSSLFRRGDDQHRFQRGRRPGRVGSGGRFSFWISLLVVFMLLYTSFVGRKIWFYHSGLDSEDSTEVAAGNELDEPETKMERYEDDANGHHKYSRDSVKDESRDSRHLSNSASQMGNISDRLVWEEGQKTFEEENLPHSTGKHRRRKYFPCEVTFSNSSENLVEPKDFLKFTQFSLEYIEEEESPYWIDPRFGGHQSLEERENTFYARDQRLHCGFVNGPEGSPSTGFDLSVKDKESMKSCHIVVSSCIFGNSDFLRRPTSKKMTAHSKETVCFVMFVDEATMTKLSLEGQTLDERGYVGLWKLIVVQNLPYNDMRRTGKVPKFLSHRLFPASRYSIWIDSKLRLQADPILIVEHFLWQKGAEYAISNHYDRHCVWEEVLQNKRLNKYNHSAIDEQFLFYQRDGLTRFNASNENNVLPSYVPEGSFIVRAHTPMSNLFSCLWFNEVDRFTSRDQLSFAYTFLKLKRMNPGKPFHLNMFRDCERRAMTKLFHHRIEVTSP